MVGSRMQKFEDLIAWQKARKLTMAIYKITKNEMFNKLSKTIFLGGLNYETQE